jgi:DNA-binding NarL/FixJ family response regulator
MRILVADHQPKVRFALQTLLRQRPGLEVVGEAATAGELLALARTAQPDLILLHWRLSQEAEQVLHTLNRACPGVRVIALSARPEARQEALAAGVDAFVCKTDQPEVLLAAIHCAGQDPVLHSPAARDPIVHP